MSLFADYKLEHAGKFTIENDHGFAIYSIEKDICYLEDIYVVPAKRRSGFCYEMADWVVALAKDNGCKKLMGSIVPSANGAQESLLVLINYGFRVYSSHDNIVFFMKDI